MSKRAVIHITMEQIHQLLGLPDDVEVLHVIPANYGLALDLVITAPDMAETDTAIGARPPSAQANFVSEDGVRYLASLSYPSWRR